MVFCQAREEGIQIQTISQVSGREENKTDIHFDNNVMWLVVETIDNGKVEEDKQDHHTNQRESYISESDIDLGLLRLVDDQPSYPTTGQAH